MTHGPAKPDPGLPHYHNTFLRVLGALAVVLPPLTYFSCKDPHTQNLSLVLAGLVLAYLFAVAVVSTIALIIATIVLRLVSGEKGRLPGPLAGTVVYLLCVLSAAYFLLGFLSGIQLIL